MQGKNKPPHPVLCTLLTTTSQKRYHVYNLMLTESALTVEDRQLTLKKMIARLCEERGVEVTFMTNRRLSDKVTCVIGGARDLVLPLPMLILENLVKEDLEVIRSRQAGFDYLLQLVITQDLKHQFGQTPERRAKLRKNT